MNPYDVLEIAPGASAEEIKAAYHRQAKQWHPDRFSGEAKAQAEARFRMLAEAFAMLKDVPSRPAPAAPAAPAAQAAPEAPAIQLDTPQDRPPQARTSDEWFAEAKTAFDQKGYPRALAVITYALRMEPERAEFHALHARILQASGGDKRAQVRSLELAIKFNAKDVDSTILLAETFQNLGMHARATRLWNTAYNLNPAHPVFNQQAKEAAKAKGVQGGVTDLREQLNGLWLELSTTVAKLFKKG